MRTLIRTGLLLAMIVMTGCATTTVREHPELETHLRRVNSIVIAPPAVNIQQINFTGENERLAESETAIRAELIKLAQSALQSKGFEVIEFDFETAISEDEEFAYTLNQVSEGFSEARKQLYARAVIPEDEKRSIKASVGTAVNMVSEKSGADAVMLINYEGMKKSGGEVAKDVAVAVMLTLLTGSTPVSNTEASYVEIAVVDGVTGDITWSNIFNSPQLSTQGATAALQPLPNDIKPDATEK
jgi:hypothetical protein